LDLFNVDTCTWRPGVAQQVEFHHAQAAVLDGRNYIIGATTGDAILALGKESVAQ